MPTEVLLVDDETNILMTLGETLRAAGFEIFQEESGEAALGRLAIHKPDLMVVDLRMPGMSGLELIKAARNTAPDTVVIILTGYGDLNSAVEALRLDAYDYLTKPVDADRLIQTLRKGAEHRKLTLENRALIRSLEEANRIKSEFISAMSHEFRTPLGHILGFVQILQDTLEGLTEKQDRYLQNIQSAATRLLTMFEDILQFSILKSGHDRISPIRFALSEFLERSLEAFKGAMETRNLTVQLASPKPDRTITADPETCRKILSLLIDNAVKFTQEVGQIQIKTEILPEPALPAGVLEPEMADTIADGWLHITVGDTGPGISQADRERIFNLFEQGRTAIGRSEEGTGLGLPLARSLARMHGGTITLDSRPGEGSNFTMIIPLGESLDPSPT